MSKFQYALYDDNTYIYPNELKSYHKNQKFKCPTPNCNATLIPCSINGKKEPYFRALDIKEHKPFCFLGDESFNSNNYDKSNINIENIFKSTINSKYNKNINIVNKHDEEYNKNIHSDNGNLLSIKTFTQLFYSLKQTNIYNYIDSNKKNMVKDILVDIRTKHIYFLYLQGIKIVECRVSSYENKDLSLNVTYPIDENTLKLKLIFDNFEDYNYIKKHFKRNKENKFNFKNLNNFIAVIGEWENKTCYIKNKKQIIFPKYNN